MDRARLAFETKANCIDIARRHGLIPMLMRADLLILAARRPGIIFDNLELAAALRGLAYSEGEIAAFLSAGASPS